jgi:hypothetical protein
MKSIDRKELIPMLQRFRKRQEYAALKKSCEAKVTEWRWATSLMLPEQPHVDLLHGLKLPRWSKKQTRYGSLHGLDADGPILCIRGGERTKPDEEVYEQFLIHEDGGFWCIYFGNDAKKSLLAVKWHEMEGDRWLRSLALGHYGVQEYLVDWEGDRCVRYTWRIWDSVTIRDAKPADIAALRDQDVDEIVYSYSYAPDGTLERVTSERAMGDGEPPLIEVEYPRGRKRG